MYNPPRSDNWEFSTPFNSAFIYCYNQGHSEAMANGTLEGLESNPFDFGSKEGWWHNEGFFDGFADVMEEKHV